MKQNTKLFAIIFLIAGSLAAGFAATRLLLAPTTLPDAPRRESVANPPQDSAPHADIPKLVVLKEPRVLPDVPFQDGEGKDVSLKDWRGKIVVVNLWATWCAPCKVEMPTLDRLQATLGGADLAVVALSLDRTGPDAPRKFLEGGDMKNLPLFIDDSGEAGFKLKAAGLPTTLIIDKEGREIARLAGTAEWDSAAVIALLRRLMAGEALSTAAAAQ